MSDPVVPDACVEAAVETARVFDRNMRASSEDRRRAALALAAAVAVEDEHGRLLYTRDELVQVGWGRNDGCDPSLRFGWFLLDNRESGQLGCDVPVFRLRGETDG